MLNLKLYPAIAALNGKTRFSCNLSTSATFALREDFEACHEIVSDAKPGFKHIVSLT